MGVHEQCLGATNEWYTPAHVFEAMDVMFDLDVAAPKEPISIPAYRWVDRICVSGSLESEWSGFVWMNPPFGGRNGIVPWLDKFFQHGNGVALTPDRTSAPWWQEYAAKADALLFVHGKLKFIGADGLPGMSPAQGTTLMAAGDVGVHALRNAAKAGLGLLLARPQQGGRG